MVTHTLVGHWRIEHMDVWDREAIDLEGPAFIEIQAGGGGQFRFLAVEGLLDCRFSEREGRPRVEFSWDGNDECDPASGRGWAEVAEGGLLEGHLFIHLGEDSAFTARRDRRQRDRPTFIGR